MITDDWYYLYKEKWGTTIIPEAVVHPAKYSRRLIDKIYQHATDEGWLSPGDWVIDPFGGVALGSLDAIRRGINWIGIELEQRFYDLGGHGYNCPGITKQDYKRFHHRPHLNYTVYHICPSCDELLRSVPDNRIIPTSNPHNFTGNLGKWHDELIPFGDRIGTSIWIRGDSRNLGMVVNHQVVDTVISSPPYADTPIKKNHMTSKTRVDPNHPEYRPSWADKFKDGYDDTVHDYGHTPGQLGDLPPGDISLSITSPPYADQRIAKNDPGINLEKQFISYKKSGGGQTWDQFVATQQKHAVEYGYTPGQLQSLPEGNLDVSISSPPFGIAFTRDRHQVSPGEIADQMTRAYTQDRQGIHPGNLSALDASISSPPYGDIEQSGSTKGLIKHGTGLTRGARSFDEYGSTPGQLGKLDMDRDDTETFWDASKNIVEQVYRSLSPGGHSIWVVKAYVKNGEYIDFPDQWKQLCESIGFITLHVHRCWMVEDYGSQYDLFGDIHTKTIERKSFFRRLAEKKGSPRIDYEIVLCMEKPIKPYRGSPLVLDNMGVKITQ